MAPEPGCRRRWGYSLGDDLRAVDNALVGPGLCRDEGLELAGGKRRSGEAGVGIAFATSGVTSASEIALSRAAMKSSGEPDLAKTPCQRGKVRPSKLGNSARVSGRHHCRRALFRAACDHRFNRRRLSAGRTDDPSAMGKATRLKPFPHEICRLLRTAKDRHQNINLVGLRIISESRVGAVDHAAIAATVC
ncbi:hypothetical protein GGE12_001380 [Rhizobium mongolense]|uniref:Uncharacterized protein n=1 Tax=Rhizobium mongolense TaxID=57676 RepID=A0A7W6RJH4_9HYPH|nr:hypothetical protein [Rhizobium mongolense]